LHLLPLLMNLHLSNAKATKIAQMMQPHKMVYSTVVAAVLLTLQEEIHKNWEQTGPRPIRFKDKIQVWVCAMLLKLLTSEALQPDKLLVIPSMFMLTSKPVGKMRHGLENTLSAAWETFLFQKPQKTLLDGLSKSVMTTSQQDTGKSLNLSLIASNQEWHHKWVET
jgi:hypothetical protein